MPETFWQQQSGDGDGSGGAALPRYRRAIVVDCNCQICLYFVVFNAVWQRSLFLHRCKENTFRLHQHQRWNYFYAICTVMWTRTAQLSKKWKKKEVNREQNGKNCSRGRKYHQQSFFLFLHIFAAALHSTVQSESVDSDKALFVLRLRWLLLDTGK